MRCGLVVWSCGTLFWALAAPLTAADAPRLVAHWPLTADARDVGPLHLPTEASGVSFGAEGPTKQLAKAATFDGRASRLVVQPADAARPGTGDFTIALWVHTDETSRDDLGDLVSWFDPVRRVGWQLGLATQSGVTSSQANTRQLCFGTDAGSEPRWQDEGRPGGALFAFALAVHDGALYAGTCEPAADAAGHVYRYAGPNQWVDLGAPDRANTISAMAPFRGRLHVASSKYRLKGSALPESENPHDGGRVYRLEADGRWTQVGELAGHAAVGGMVEYDGQLYASSLYPPAGLYRWDGDGAWESVATPGGRRVEPLAVYDGALWAGSYDGGYVFRYDGQSWREYGPIDGNTQTYSFAMHRGKLHVGTWPSGKAYRLEQDEWRDAGRLGKETEVMGMLVHNGKLYGGTLPLAEVYRLDGDNAWTQVGRLDHTPDVTYRRAWTMAQHQGRLFVSTLPSGTIHSLSAGACVTLDRAFPTDWRQVTAVRQADRLRLYVDGEPVAESAPAGANFDLSPDAPLVIGHGAGDYFRGRLCDVRLYRGALSADAIRELAKR